MSRRARARAAAVEAKRAFAWVTPVVHDYCVPEDAPEVDALIDAWPLWSCPGCCKAKAEPFHCTACNADAEGHCHDAHAE